jgi:hypothetical protein
MAGLSLRMAQARGSTNEQQEKGNEPGKSTMPHGGCRIADQSTIDMKGQNRK